MYKNGRLNNSDDVVNPDSDTFEYRERSKKEFVDFVLETHRRLMSLEAKTIGAPSTLSIFCRIDVGIYIDAEGNGSYFVNEVERTLTTSLWVREKDIPVNSVASTIGKGLNRWIHQVNNM